MTPNNNLNVLPWYGSVDRQSHHKYYAYGQIYPLLTPEKTLLPFQIQRTTRSATITEVLLKNLDGTTFADITADILLAGLHVVSYSAYGFDLIVNHGTIPFPTVTTPEGQFYAQLSDGVETWYSEVFTFSKHISTNLKLSYWDNAAFVHTTGVIDYDSPYKSTMYICAQLGKPEYTFEEEVSKRDGYNMVEKQISEKRYRFTMLGPEFICDALRIVRMHDNVTITDVDGLVYEADSFLITPKWLDDGYLASIEVEFECNTVIKKIAKAGIIGDFNVDFNNDYN